MEKKVYVINADISLPDKLTDEEFIEFAGKSVFTLDQFAKGYNNGHIATTKTYIRFI